jgi:hypothetical protein
LTDAELVTKKLALIETYVRELRSLPRPLEIERDLREERFVEHTEPLSRTASCSSCSPGTAG